MNTDLRRKRLAEIETVLVRTVILNFAVGAAKIWLGAVTGIFTIVADGLHALGDTLSNVIGIAGTRFARRDPDERYPYGYDKFESIATLVIAAILSVACFEVAKSAIGRIFQPEPPTVTFAMLVVLVATMAVNAVIVNYEGGAGERLGSELLVADANETKSDLYISFAVIWGVILMRFTGWPWLDGVLSLGVAFAILNIVREIFADTVKILADGQVVPSEEVEGVVLAVPGAEFCHAIRSRGRPNGFFLELHLGVRPELSIEAAHDDVCHRVKEALHRAFPNLKSANIHIEPDNESGRSRGRSVFKDRDPYDH